MLNLTLNLAPSAVCIICAWPSPARSFSSLRFFMSFSKSTENSGFPCEVAREITMD